MCVRRTLPNPAYSGSSINCIVDKFRIRITALWLQYEAISRTNRKQFPSLLPHLGSQWMAGSGPIRAALARSSALKRSPFWRLTLVELPQLARYTRQLFFGRFVGAGSLSLLCQRRVLKGNPVRHNYSHRSTLKLNGIEDILHHWSIK